MKRIIVAGDKVLPDIIDKIRSHRNDIEIVNEYGPTENSIASTFYEFPVNGNGNSSKIIPIGKPLANTRAYILGE